jgi:hypothetical protein
MPDQPATPERPAEARDIFVLARTLSAGARSTIGSNLKDRLTDWVFELSANCLSAGEVIEAKDLQLAALRRELEEARGRAEDVAVTIGRCINHLREREPDVRAYLEEARAALRKEVKG